MGKLAGKFPGGYGGAKGATNNKGYDTGTGGRGTMPYTTTNVPNDVIHTVPQGQRPPMPMGKRGRVVYGGNSRTGRKEGTGPEGQSGGGY